MVSVWWFWWIIILLFCFPQNQKKQNKPFSVRGVCVAVVLGFHFPTLRWGVLMVGIPMDRVGAEYVGMWLLLYREWDCFSRVMWGILSSHHATPNRSSRISSPKQWVFCALYPLLFFFYGGAWVVAIVMVVLVHLCCYHLA